MTPADLSARYQSLLTCPQLIDTRDHLPLFHSLPGRILEIGCDVGNSTTAFLDGQSTNVVSIDINPACAQNFPGIEKWRFVLGRSGDPEVRAKAGPQWFDVLYIDGGHDYDTVACDLITYSNKVIQGGLILVHDVLATDNFPGVWRAFNDFRRGRSKYVLPGSYGLGVIEL